MKTAFVHVNYNNSDLTINCIQSIIDCNEDSTIVIIDNNSEVSEKNKLTNWILNNKKINSNVKFIAGSKNHGYFGGLNIGLNFLRNTINSYDYVIVGNNDLIFNKSFFEELGRIKVDDDIFVISPNIIKNKSVHQNPFLINRTSNIRLLSYYLYFSNYYIAMLMLFLTNLLNISKSEKDRAGFETSQNIFAGHGSCYVLTKLYFKNNLLLNDSSFLMGEEFLLAKQIRDTGGKIYYSNSLEVTHNEHSTLSKMPSKMIYKYEQIAFKITKKIR